MSMMKQRTASNTSSFATRLRMTSGTYHRMLRYECEICKRAGQAVVVYTTPLPLSIAVNVTFG
eukprot:7682421-Lingulodinium_polyedra.AAC.1